MRMRHLCALLAGFVLVLNSGCWCHRWCHRRNCRPNDDCCDACTAPAVDCHCCGAPPAPVIATQPPPPGHEK
jgi:hypothetical protein